MDAARSEKRLSPFEQLRYAREILRGEAQAVLGLADRLGEPFCRAVELLHHCAGHVLVCGMGKAGLIGQKITATFSSTGTRSHFLHPAEAIHGDLGMIHPHDVLLLLSFSGESEEMVRLLPFLTRMGNPRIAMTGNPHSSLAIHSDVVLGLGPIREVCVHGLAPSTSTTAMLALGDALALVTSRLRGFGPEDFARFHPGGSLGRQLARVEDAMRKLDQCRVAREDATVREVFVSASRPGRRTGAIMLVDLEGRLTGLFTDSDLARLLECQWDASIDQPIRSVMTQRPVTVTVGTRMQAAWDILAARRISEIPVVDADGRPAGLIDITDVFGAENFEVDESPAGGRSAVDEPLTFRFPGHDGDPA